MKIYYIDEKDLKIKSKVYTHISSFESFYNEMDSIYPLGWSGFKGVVQEILDEI